ncbi:MAG: pyridoxamine 5'-phosphate oxidase family protein [Acidimicrobiia bacterium]|nr:pyridoxamine 5'-phosphate oxidase family protein [Acidimicrobiia bacterium]
MPKLTDAELHDFLDEGSHLLRLATIDADGMPRLVPVWYTHRDGSILFTPRAESVFLANLRRDPRLALSIDEDPLPYRKVSVQGRAEIVHEIGTDDQWRDIYREIACRYIEPEAADRYLTATIDQPRALVAVDLADSEVSTWRMPIDDEPGTGIWARRYYAPGSRMAETAGRLRR